MANASLAPVLLVSMPQMVDPNNAMPNLGITPSDARDLTAFLDTLK